MALSELKAQMALGEDSRCQFRLKRGTNARRKFGEEFGESLEKILSGVICLVAQTLNTQASGRHL